MTYCYACDRFVAVPVIVEHRPYCQRCAEVTARIDAVIREGNMPDSGNEPVPLAEQIAQYGIMAEEVLDALAANLADPWFRNAIIRLGIERLCEGYDEFGSQMYEWDANKRDDEMFEELADFVVYGTSGSFFDVRVDK